MLPRRELDVVEDQLRIHSMRHGKGGKETGGGDGEWGMGSDPLARLETTATRLETGLGYE